MLNREVYRSRTLPAGLKSYTVQVEETDLLIHSSLNHKELATELVHSCRKVLTDYIALYPSFLNSLRPIKCATNAPEIVREMIEASARAGVGPMAAVAGAVAAYVGVRLKQHSPEVIIENGGDVFMSSKVARRVLVYAGDSPLSQKIALAIDPSERPLGICTSAGKFGHSLSFGNCHAAVVVSQSTALADAAATALGNLVKREEDIRLGLRYMETIPGVDGAIAIINNHMGAFGNIRLVKA